jgi:hypothetical protein
MADSGVILQATDSNLEEILQADWGVLILSKTVCGPCAAYQADIEALRERGELAGVVIGKMVLDKPGATQFKRDNRWLSGVDFLPYTLLYHNGRQADAFAASRGSYLLERLEDAAKGS